MDNVTRSSDHITAILKTVPVQQPAFLESRYNEWLEQGEPGKCMISFGTSKTFF